MKRKKLNGLLKKIIKSLCCLFCIILFILSLNNVPDIKVNLYDMIIYKVSNILISMLYLIPIIFVFNFKFKDKLLFFRKKKYWYDIFGFIIIFLFIFSFSNIVILFHSKDYKENYEKYNTTKIVYHNIENEDGNVNDNLNVLNDTSIASNEQIKVHYIDVGQGDSIFIELPNKKVMLIDAGESSKGLVVCNYIKSLGYSEINYLVGTHPHADHIGGLAYVINNFTIGSIYMPKAVSTSKTYEDLLSTILNKNLKVINAKAGINILSENNLKIDIIAPNSNYYNELNNYSVVVKIIYGNRKFLFMGDAETKSENEILSDVSADVIKIGHHGSNSSSGQNFINKVNAKYAIIMVGNNNKYNHPYKEIIDRWISSGATIYRTDLNGNIVVKSDGNSLDVSSSK